MRFAPLALAIFLFALDLVQGISSLSPRLTIKPSLALFLWVLSLAIVSGSVFYSVVEPFRKRANWTLPHLLTFVFAVAIVGFGLATPLSEFSDPLTMHPEAARQAACGSGKWVKEGGLGEVAYSWCFLGYNTRQYIPQALLWRFFGPSTFNLNVVYVFFLVMGFSAYAVGLRKAVERGYGGYVLLLTALLMPLQSYYYFFLTTAYEQSIFPVCLTLLALGLLVQSALAFTAWNVGLALLSIQWLLFSYTPSLSVYFFAAGMLAILAFYSLPTRRARIGAFVAISAYAVMHFVLSLGLRFDIKLTKAISASAAPDTPSTISPLLRAVFYRPWGAKAVHSSAYSMACVLISLVLLLCVKNSKARIMAACAFAWSAAHILLAAYAKGYAAPPIPFSLHRALPVLPVFGLLIFFGFGTLRNKGPKPLFPAICVLLCGLHLSLALSEARSHTPDLAVKRRATFPHAEVLDQLYLQLTDKNIKHVVVGPFFDNDRARKTFPDFASYYFPEAKWSRSDLPAVPPWFNPSDPFLGLFVGGASDVEPIISGAKSLPEGIEIVQVIRVPKVRNSDQPLAAFSYTRRLTAEPSAEE